MFKIAEWSLDVTDRDDFWDLTSLVPKKRPPTARRERDTEAVTVDIDVPPIAQDTEPKQLSARFREVTDAGASGARGVNRTESRSSGDRLRLPPRDSVSRARASESAEPILEYEPQGGLIRRVRVMQWPSRYSFYEQFRFDAKKYQNVIGEKCDEVEFFSYTPQYRQMTRTQLDYYFWWRENARAGVWLPASFSYVLLYIYEIINLREIIEPAAGAESLCRVWLAYRGKYKVLDKYLSEWVADYCLINKLNAPRELLAPIMHEIMENSTLREFYMTGGIGGISAESLCEIFSDYDWRRGKFAQDENYSALYKTHMPAALAAGADAGGFSCGEMRAAVVSRDAFCGSLCAHNVKCRIDIEYLSYVRSRELRAQITELVKYTENKLRASVGIRSRLRAADAKEDTEKSGRSVGDDKLKAALAAVDEYFAREFSNRQQSASRRRADEEEYDESMYEALSVGIDADSAAEIERASWASTELLTDTETAAQAPKEPIPQERTMPAQIQPEQAPPEAESCGGIYSRLDGDAAEFLRLVLAGADETEQSRFCRERGVYADEIAARVNDAAVDTDAIGDIVLEASAAGGYSIVEDYRSDLE